MKRFNICVVTFLLLWASLLWFAPPSDAAGYRFGATKPPLGAQVAWGHPLAPTRSWLMNEQGGREIRDVVSAEPGTLTGLIGDGPDWSGGSLSFSQANEDRVETSYRNTKRFTWFARVRLVSSTSSQFRSILSEGGAQYILMNISNGNTNGSFWTVDGLSDAQLGVSLTVGQWHTVALVREGDSITGGYRAYQDGIETGTGNTGVYTPSDDVWIGSRKGQTSQGWDGDIALAYIFDYAVPASEISRIHSNKFAFIRGPLNIPLYYTAPAVGGAARRSIISLRPRLPVARPQGLGE